METKEKKPRGFGLISAKKKGDLYSAQKASTIFLLKRVNKKPSIPEKRQPLFPEMYCYPGIDIITHKGEDGKLTQRMIRHIPGEASIFADQQSVRASNNDVVPIYFKDGSIELDYTLQLTKQFLELSNGNGDNELRSSKRPPVYVKWNPAEVAEEAVNKDMEIARAMVLFGDMEKDNGGLLELKAYAETLNLNTNRPWSVIRHDLLFYLKNNPTDFLDGLDSPKMKRKYNIMQALKAGVILKDPNSGAISFNGGGATICTPPIGVDPVNYMVDWSQDKGQETYEHLEKLTNEFYLKKG